MANAYSTAVAYNEYISPVNLSLVNTVLASKEQKYNANMAKIDSVLESYGNMDFYRDEDKQMMYENINVMLDSMQGLDKMALSNSDTIRNINNSFKNAVTPYLQQQLVNTAKIRSTFSNINELKQKGDEAYNEGNVSFMLHNAGFEQYANGEADSIGDLNYIPYYNLDKAVMEEIKVWAKDFGVSERIVEEMVNHGGTTYAIQQISKETLSPESVKNMVYNKLRRDPRAMQQVDINAWNQYNGMDDEEFTTTYRTTAKTAQKSYQESIAKIDAQLKTAIPNTERHAVLTAQREEAVLNRDSYQKIADSTEPLNRRAVERQIYIDQFASGYAQTYSFDRTTNITYNDLPMKIAKEVRAEEKHALEILKLQQETGTSAGRAGSPDENVTGTRTAVSNADDLEAVAEDYSKVIADREQEFENLKAKLQVHDPKYKEFKTEEEKNAYVEELLKVDYDTKVGIDGGTGAIIMPPQEVVDALQKVKTLDSGINRYTEVVNTQMDNMVSTFYGGLTNSYHTDPERFRRLTANEVINMPTTMEVMAANKSWADLSEQERAEVKWETLGRVNHDIVGNRDAAGKSVLKVGMKIAEAEMQKFGGYSKAGQLVDEIPRGSVIDSLYGLGYAVAGVVEGAGRLIGSGVQSLITGVESDISLRPVSWDRAEEEFARSSRSISNTFATSETMNDWSNAEVSIDGKSAAQYWKEGVEAIKAETTSGLLATEETMQAEYMLTTNPNSSDKAEQKRANDLETIASAYKQVTDKDGNVTRGFVPVKGSPIVTKFNEDRSKVIMTVPMEVKYTDDKGVKKTMIDNQDMVIPATAFTHDFLSDLGGRAPNWSLSAKNPNKVTPTFEYNSLPTTVESKEKIANNVGTRLIQSGIPQDSAVQIAEMASRRQSDWIATYEPYLTTTAKKNMAKDLVNSKFNVIFDGSEETGFIPKVDITYPNGETETVIINNNLHVSVVENVEGRTSSGVQAISKTIEQLMYKIIQTEENAR